MPEENYEPRLYWERLLSSDFSISGVSHPYLPSSFNRYIYRAMERSIRTALERSSLPHALEEYRVLDVGSGIGAWLAFWRRLGVSRLAGVDLTDVSVTRLRERHPDIELRRADIRVDDLKPLGAFDIVSVVNVLLHLTDDEDFSAAVANIGSVLGAGGVLIVIDPVVVRRWWGGAPGAQANSRSRSLDDWRETLAVAGLRIAAVLPVTYLLDSPVDTRSPRFFRLLMRYWDSLCRLLHGNEIAGAVIGAALYRLDSLLVRSGRAGPSLKCLVIMHE